MLFAKADDDVFQCEVDPSRYKGRRQCQTADLNVEASQAKRVVVKQDPTNISQAFGPTAKGHCNKEGPRSVADAEEDIDDRKDAEERSKEGIDRKVWVIAID